MAWALDRPRGLRWHGRETLTGEGLRAIAVPPGVLFAGILIALVGIWGAISVFVGPVFGWGPTTGTSWSWTTQNWMLHLAPGAAALVCGILILAANPRRLAGGRGVIDLAALVVVAAGVWFVIGPALWGVFETGPAFTSGTPTNEFWYQLGSSLGPGLALTFLGGMALKAGITRTGMAVAEPVPAAPVAAAHAAPVTRAPLASEAPVVPEAGPVTETRIDEPPVV